MKRIIHTFLFVLSLGNLSQLAHAQQYPVQANVQLLPPYSVYLSDYANERLVVQLQLRDISKGEIPVRLRWQIRGGGVYLETNTTYLPTPNTVGVGMPLRLDGYDLAPYLRPENLLGNGGTAAWRRQAQLPEGMYTFCVQVLDDVTGAVVSNAACASAWLLRHEPPFLNLPEPEAKPEARDPQQLTFQWTPRHTGRPNANFQTEYDFRLVEIWPDDRDPNDAMQSSIPLYETTTASTMLVYGMAEPLLIPGRRYAWQVRARSLVNGEALTMFNNQGNSEVRSFRWGDACVAITEVRAEALSGGRIRLRWEAPGTHSSYRVQYRQRGTSRWYQQESFQPEAIITRLQPSTAYEYQVGGYCGSIAAGLSTLASVGTLEEAVPEYACGLPVPAPNQESAHPLPQLRVGEVIQAADFSVTVTESSGQSGQFSGKGTVALPWLREAVAQVTFQEVQINEAYQLTAGELVVTGVALEVMPEELTDALAEVYDVVDQASEAMDRAEEKLEAVDEALATAQEVYQKAQEVIGEDRSSSEPESGTPGAEVPPANGGPAPAADGSGGNVNVADGSSGTSADSARPTAASEAQDSVDVRVQFRPNANQAYGFDRKEHDALAADYPPTLINGETYSPAWKSVAAGRTDYVDAVVVAPDSSSVVVKFRTATGQSIAAQPGAKDSEQQLPVVGTTHETVDALSAYVVESDTAGDETETTVGQLNVISYDELRQKVIVVPVNDAIAPDAVRLSQDLNAIYGAAVAHWEVVIDDAFVAEAELLTGLDEGESGLLASFPRPMRQFNRAFKRSRDIDKDAYYVFLVADVSSSRAGQSRRGFMPFKQQFGYIFTEQVTNLSQTIAHELGHGAFRLRHPFDEFGLAKGTTDNLMDYSEGTALYKYQWDNVHDPEAMVGWLQGDEESASFVSDQYESEGILELLSTSNYVLGKKKVILHYKLKNWKNRMSEEAQDLNKENYSLMLFVEHKAKVVYSFKKELEESGSIDWHGLVVHGEIPITSKNASEYKLHLGIVKKSEIASVDKWLVSLGSRPASTVIKSNQDDSKHYTFVDLIQSIPFTKEKAWENWQAANDETKSITSNYETYRVIEKVIREQSDGIGNLFSDIENPLQFLYDNTVETTFLGTKVRVHWTFVAKLQAIEARILNEGLRQGYYKQGHIVGIGIRPMYGKNKVYVSNHSYGVVVDIKANYNHYISNDQEELIYFIEHVTGLNIFDEATRSPTTITAASQLFIQEVRGLSYEKLLSIYAKIDDYQNQGDRYSLEDLEALNPFHDLKMIRADVGIGIIEKDVISSFYGKLTKLRDILNQKEQKYYLEYVTFDETARQELTNLRERVNSLALQLQPIEDDFSEENIIEVFAVVSTPLSPSVINFTESYQSYRAVLREKFVQEEELSSIVFKRYASMLLERASNESFIKYIFQNGFCEVPLEIIEAFLAEKDVQWGGTWNSSNVDYMHFEIKKKAISKYLSQEKLKR